MIAQVHYSSRSSPRQWRSRSLGSTAKFVCGPCNNGWMSRLEGKARPILTPMIKGHGTTLTLDDQQIAARWMAKTAALSRYTIDPPRPSVTERLDWIANRDDPPSNLNVYLAAYAGRSWPSRVDHHSWEMGSPVAAFNNLHIEVSTFLIGHLIIHAIEGPHDAPDLHFSAKTHLASAVLQIWPATASVGQWPPRIAMNDADYIAYAQPRPPRLH